MANRCKALCILNICVAIFAFSGCKASLALKHDMTFQYMCKSQVGPIICGVTNVIDVLQTLHKGGNLALSDDGCQWGFSIVSSGIEMNRQMSDSLVVPRSSIHDACMMIAHHYDWVYTYQNGLVRFSSMTPSNVLERCSNCEQGRCSQAEIGPFDFRCQSMCDIFAELCISGNEQLRANGHRGFFLAQLVFDGVVENGHTIRVERGQVQDVLHNVAMALNLNVACDHECFYIYQSIQEIQGMGKSVVLIGK